MIEIFVPEKLLSGLKMNEIPDSFDTILGSSFDFRTEPFSSRHFSGIAYHFSVDDPDFIIPFNGAFGKRYFIRYDPLAVHLAPLGMDISRFDAYSDDISRIRSEYDSLLAMLHSESLLTRSKKDEMISHITDSYFMLSGVSYVMGVLLQECIENLADLETLSSDPRAEIAYSAQASLLRESLITKKAELEGKIAVFDSWVGSFVATTSGFL